MSLPQNNLDDLRRRAQAGSSAGYTMHLHDEGQPKVRVSRCSASFRRTSSAPEL